MGNMNIEYIKGFINGEGCFQIQRINIKDIYPFRCNYRFTIAINLKYTDIVLLHKIKDTWVLESLVHMVMFVYIRYIGWKI